MTPAPPNKKAALRGGRVAGPGEQLLAELRPGQSIELLKELHILTREGQLNQDSRRKLKQVYHLFHFIEKILADLFELAARILIKFALAGQDMKLLEQFNRLPSLDLRSNGCRP